MFPVMSRCMYHLAKYHLAKALVLTPLKFTSPVSCLLDSNLWCYH